MKILKNVSPNPVTVLGVTIDPNDQYIIPQQNYFSFAESKEVLELIVNETLIVNNGVDDLSVPNGIALIQNNVNKISFDPSLLNNNKLRVELEQPRDSAGRPIFTGAPFSDSGGFRFRGASFKGTISPNSTENIDYKITQERWINGGMAIIDNIGPDDQVTFQVVDKDNILGYGAGVVLDEFISGYYIPQNGNLEIQLAYPARIIAGLYLRLRYTSTHALGCTVKCNLYLHWKTS
jgi:hypothetical protein